MSIKDGPQRIHPLAMKALRAELLRLASAPGGQCLIVPDTSHADRFATALTCLSLTVTAFAVCVQSVIHPIESSALIGRMTDCTRMAHCKRAKCSNSADNKCPAVRAGHLTRPLTAASPSTSSTHHIMSARMDPPSALFPAPPTNQYTSVHKCDELLSRHCHRRKGFT